MAKKIGHTFPFLKNIKKESASWQTPSRESSIYAHNAMAMDLGPSGLTPSTPLSSILNVPPVEAQDDGQSWILQHNGFDCLLVALVNALRYFKRPTPRFRSPEYQELIRISGSSHGPATRFHEACDHLGLKITHVPYDYAIQNAPGIVSVENPHPGTFLHAVFVTPERRAINHYWLTGPVECSVEEMIPWTRFGNWIVELA